MRFTRTLTLLCIAAVALFAIACDDGESDDNGNDMTTTDATSTPDATSIPDATTMMDGTSTPDMVAATEFSVVVEDQLPEPLTRVIVGSAGSVGNGFVVIHEDVAGAPGGVIGQTSVADGVSTNVIVNLDRDAVAGETLWAMMHMDAGEIGTYEFPGADEPALDDTGAVVQMAFDIVALAPEVQVADQTADPANTVVIVQVVNNNFGFVVIHEDAAGAPGAVLGNTLVGHGTTDNVPVVLNRDAVAGETLWAMLHTDGDGNMMYEFPGPDEPTLDAGGNIVQGSFVTSLRIGSVTANDQDVSPLDEVTIATTTSIGPGFIVIHEDAAGAPGAVIGNAPVADGLASDTLVTLDRDTTDGEVLWAMLHIDGDADGVYTFPGADSPAMDNSGNVVQQSFIANHIEQSITADDQLLVAANQVTVQSLFSNGPGFIVIHADAAGSPGMPIGNVAVPEGASTDVVVTLDRDAGNQEPLHAMLHDDSDENGVYEPPANDPPSEDKSGMIVNDPFTVTVQ